MSNVSAEEEYQRAVQARIETMTSPDEFITGIVERAGYPPPMERVRITEGFSNEVYRIRTVDGQELIVRIHWYFSPHFEAEAWALAQCKQYHIPAPRILHLEHQLPGDVPKSACVETVIPGKTLHSLLKAHIYRPEDCRPLLVELGVLLAKIHAIPTTGFGPINGDGIGPKTSWSEYLFTEPDDQLLQAAGNVQIAQGHVQAACRLLTECLPLWQNVQPRLLHGDLSLNHIMVDSGRVSGLIDFEFPNSGDPAMDLAYWGCWDFFKGFSLPVQWIMEGYAQATHVDGSFELRVLASRLQLSLQLLRYHGIHDANTPGMAVYLQQRFQHDFLSLKNGYPPYLARLAFHPQLTGL